MRCPQSIEVGMLDQVPVDDVVAKARPGSGAQYPVDYGADRGIAGAVRADLPAALPQWRRFRFCLARS